ncbi:MAG: type IV pilus secretin PilQ, partial [Chromatiaceae bacterium]|nr:type IV pilus secretin PilQ [Chromatiaceae bacterium]
MVLLLVFGIVAVVARAATTLDDVQFAALPGNQVRIELVLSGPVSAPKAFATDQPARIALDFEGVGNRLQQRNVPVGVGVVESIAAVEASDRTRVVINLNDSAPYEVITSGNRVSVAINSAAAAAPPAAAAVRTSAAPPAAPSSGPGIQDIDFRRGPAGEGRVMITLPSADTRASVNEKGARVVVEIADTTLPQRLLRRLDVTDFATPVVAVESRPSGRDVQIEIETTGEYDYMAYQADRLFTVEFRPLTPAEKEELQRSKIVYSGDRLSLNFQDIEVRAVLQLLADFTGLNLVASDTVRGNITLRLKNVPWDQALDIILKSKGLSMRQTGNVIMVAPTQEIVAQEEAELLANQKVEELAPLRSEYIQINYAKAAELATLLKSTDNRLLSPRGNVTVDPRTNTLLVQDTSANLEDIRRLITRLDVPVRQVMIESRVVIANDDFARDLGVRFGFSRWQSNGEFNNVAGGIPGHLDGTGVIVPGIEIPEGVAPLMVNLPVTDPAGAVNFLIGKVGSYLLQLELSAMQR